MSRQFWRTTAEHIILTVHAVNVNNKPSEVEFVEVFAELRKDQAEAALNMACDLEILSNNNDKYSLKSALGSLITPQNNDLNVDILRIIIEIYLPFKVFSERIKFTDNINEAARQTKALLSLDADEEEIKDTLIDLGTFTQALLPKGGGKYKAEVKSIDNSIINILEACKTKESCEDFIIDSLGEQAITKITRREVLDPLIEGLFKAIDADPKNALQKAGNAIDSYLDEFAQRNSIQYPKTGINNKLNKLRTDYNLPIKLQNMGFYIGHLRNAADHGIDSDIGVSWDISDSTGIEYVLICCKFIRSLTELEFRGNYIL